MAIKKVKLKQELKSYIVMTEKNGVLVRLTVDAKNKTEAKKLIIKNGYKITGKGAFGLREGKWSSSSNDD